MQGLHVYLLPPIRYPDGRWYLKIGGDPEDILLPDYAALQNWFRGAGSSQAAQALRQALQRCLPDLPVASFHSDSCVTSYSSHGYPYCGMASERIGVLTAGNGAAAKSSDEIGRMGALMISHDHWCYDLPAQQFALSYRK